MPARKNSAATNRIDLAGLRYGRLQVIEAGQRKGKVLYWRCRCDCGQQVVVRGQNLRNGTTKSCGCLADELRAEAGACTRTHGLTGSPTNVIWQKMRQRCNDPNASNYADYGAKGVRVCQRWDSYENFLADMGERPPGMTLDRIENSKGYEPGNCRWATRTVQAINRGNVRQVTAHGRTMAMSEWSRETGIKYNRLYHHIVTRGVDPEDVIPAPAALTHAESGSIS